MGGIAENQRTDTAMAMRTNIFGSDSGSHGNRVFEPPIVSSRGEEDLRAMRATDGA
jgi:hypothetical protein